MKLHQAATKHQALKFPPPTAAGAAGDKADTGNPPRLFPIEPLTPCQTPAGLARYRSLPPATAPNRRTGIDRSGRTPNTESPKPKLESFELQIPVGEV